MSSPALALAGDIELQRVTHYQLLGIAADERDPEVIEEAAVRRSGDVRTYQLTREDECTRLLNAIARALVTLLDPSQRAEYDRGLGKAPGRVLPGGRPESGAGSHRCGLALMPVAGGVEASRACDVELVLRAGTGGNGRRPATAPQRAAIRGI